MALVKPLGVEQEEHCVCTTSCARGSMTWLDRLSSVSSSLNPPAISSRLMVRLPFLEKEQ